MEAVGEEDEGEEDDEVHGQGLEHRQLDNQANPAFEAVIRERQLATQKARIVSQMASTRTRALSPRRTVAAPTTKRTEQTAVVKETIPAKPKKSLFDVCWANIDHGLQMASTRTGYQSSRTYIVGYVRGPKANPYAGTIHDAKPPKLFVNCWLDYSGKYGMGFAMTDGSVSVHFNDSSNVVLAPGQK